MERRKVLTAFGTVLVSGCLSSSSNEGNGNGEQQEDPVMNAEYVGTTEEHNETAIESVEYSIDGACRATISVVFANQKPAEGYIGVRLYRNEEEVGATSQQLGKFGDNTTENVDLQYCEFEKYNSFRLAVLQPEEEKENQSE
ncbi:hypothetical protein [Natrinema versiforme]|uniref:Lipoprotein n=1 Tax=Natrinema versiforme TaxID=88724 RepID=A0A4V1FZU0_9EURY|nr:hypothetical protein [Natrinema versiforme]QCS43016.1 hypothetical protein FEJ81_11845 [Natrinema versiforme]